MTPRISTWILPALAALAFCPACTTESSTKPESTGTGPAAKTPTSMPAKKEATATPDAATTKKPASPPTDELPVEEKKPDAMKSDTAKVDPAKTAEDKAAPDTGSKTPGVKAAKEEAPKATRYVITRKDRKMAKTNWIVCSTCHGMSGAGDGAAAVALNPKPRTFADAKWQASVTDERLFKVIKEGGASVGLSPLMVAYGHLKDGTVHALVEKVRSFNPEKK